MLMIPRNKCAFRERICAQERQGHTMRVIAKQVGPISREVALLRTARNLNKY